jgi:hypothetical protein
MSQRSFTSAALATSLIAGSALLPGCMLEKQDDGREFREAVPLREALVVAGPAGETGDDTNTAALGGGRPRADAPWTAGPDSKWYGCTRGVRAGVNVVTGAVLGSVWIIVHTEPSSVEDGEAIWGPYTDALDPVTYRFRVTRIADAEYDYVLEGRPKASSSNGDYRQVLSGHGYGKRHDLHGQGELIIDLDVARELDPFANADESGTVRIVHDLPRNLRRGDFLPRTIVAEVTPDPALNPESFSVTSTANEDGTGSLHVTASADVDDTSGASAAPSALEDIVVASRFRADGAGRADIAIAGGDIPADPGKVSAVECWGADFMRSYYVDSLELEPREGEPSACVYDAP